ncbi:anthrone oxygenase family protein [Streptomyces sp. NPDC000229]|uniref:anthrone oxygenase family protein n=1 Tax=Streptomyces sp. NPDC000229 TaxID=3154247 RepID=UPI0033175233
MPTLLLALAVVSTGLYAGFMLIFLTGVMPALARLTDEQFVTAMRRVNEYVPRAVFLAVFAGVVVFPALALAVPIAGRSDSQRWLILAGLVCAVLGHLVTVAGNIPLNNALAASGGREPGPVREAFESRWNAFHLLRTLLITASFALLVTASLT